MAPKGTSVPIFGCLSLFLMSSCWATARPAVLEQILDSIKNIEDLIRESSQPSLYLTTSVGRNGIVHSPQFLPSRDVVVNFDPFEEEYFREDLSKHRPRLRSRYWLPSQSQKSENANSNSNDNQLRKQTEDDIMPVQIGPRRLRLKKKQRNNDERPRESDNGNSNTNSNVNSNSNSNYNGNGRSPVDTDIRTKIPGINNGLLQGIGSRSLSHVRDINRNVNTNVNTNSIFDDEANDDEI